MTNREYMINLLLERNVLQPILLWPEDIQTITET